MALWLDSCVSQKDAVVLKARFWAKRKRQRPGSLIAGRSAQCRRGLPWRRLATVFEPIRPVPPITTIVIVHSPSSAAGYWSSFRIAGMRQHPSLDRA
jgi:hypothetical protein